MRNLIGKRNQNSGSSRSSKYGGKVQRLQTIKRATAGIAMIASLVVPAAASQAYGSINNFDCVNDTGVEAHGFEIELDYGRTTDVTYTYDYNHYGTPKVREDLSDPAHPKVFVRYESAKKPDGSWTAYTAIPSGPILPTQGHQFTDPTINFGGEHFGVGFMGSPAAVKYNWLVDDGSGNLIHGPDVYISTPTFTYVPAAPAVPAKVVAKIAPPPPPVLPPLQFGLASFVKEIKTVSHNSKKVPLKDLVGDDPGKPQPWANGEQPQVEVEWRMMQTEFGAGHGGKNGELQGAPEAMPHNNEMITRRYEFYKYVGPVDAETGEAMGDAVGPDGKHGRGTVTYADHFDWASGEWVTKTVDLSKVFVVGEFFGTQMAGFDVAPQLGLIDHIQDADLMADFPARTVVVGGGFPFIATIKSGSLPAGMSLSPVTGILAGTPTAPGLYRFTVEADDLSGAVVTKDYTVTVNGDVPGYFTVTTTASPNGGKLKGAGTFAAGTSRTITATVKAGYAFVDWTEGGVEVTASPAYTFTLDSNHDFVANFAKLCTISTSPNPAAAGSTSGDGVYRSGSSVTLSATSNEGWAFLSWTKGTSVVGKTPSTTVIVTGNRTYVANYVRTYPVTISTTPAGSGVTSGNGVYKDGTTISVRATPNKGFIFLGWSENGTMLSTSRKFTFTVLAAHSLTANFAKK